MILVIKHVDIEGPGMITNALAKTNYDVHTIDLSRGEALPDNLFDLEAVLVLGGPMNVYEEDKCPFLKAENVFLKEILKREIPLLGICLGAQLIAKACEARVRKAELPEIGWFKVRLTDEGAKDPLLSGLGEDLVVFQWHNDTFDVPKNGKLLVTARGCPNQAFRAGRCAYGLQFHIEVFEKMVEEWCQRYFSPADAKQKTHADGMLADYKKLKSEYRRQAGVFCENFLRIISTVRRS